jgi:hypothetical protein
VNENNEESRTNSDEARRDEKPTTNDGRSSLERLAAFTKRILRVPKEAIHETEPPASPSR